MSTKYQHSNPEPARPRPLKADRTFARRKADTRAWLRKLLPHEEVTSQRVLELTPYVYKYHPGSSFERIAEAMIRNGQIPDYETVKARHEKKKANQEKALRKQGQISLSPPVVEELSQYIAASWETQGHGPIWADVRTHMNWTRRQSGDALHRLAKDGIITFTKETGSLALAPAR